LLFFFIKPREQIAWKKRPANFAPPVGVAAFHKLHRHEGVEAFSGDSAAGNNFLARLGSDHKPFFSHSFQPHKITI
jgi:hypothetical protein